MYLQYLHLFLLYFIDYFFYYKVFDFLAFIVLELES